MTGTRGRSARSVAGVLVCMIVLTTPVAAQPAVPIPESGPITLVTGLDLSSDGIRRQLIGKWNHDHPNTPVNVVELPSTADLQRAQMLAAEQAGDPGYDVLNLDLTWTAEFAENGAIRPLDESVLTASNDFFDKVLESVRYQRQGSDRIELWAVPFNTDVGLLYYRKDLLGAGAPNAWTWQAMADARNRINPGKPVYTSQLKRFEGLTVNAVEAAAAAGEDLTKLTSESHGLLALASHVRDGTILPDSTTFDETGSLRAFRDGAVLFMRNWPYAYNVLTSDPDLPPGAIGVARLPRLTDDRPAPAVLGGQNLAIAAHSTRPQLARELIEFLTSPVSEQCLLERGGLAATRRAVYDPAKHPVCDLPQPSNGSGRSEGKPTATLYTSPEAMTALTSSLGDATLRPRTPYYSRTTDVIQFVVSDILTTAAGTDPYAPKAQDLPKSLTEALAGR
jgi:multiple sugar transport system substrate-binding protein